MLPVKMAGEPIDYGVLAFCLCHAAYLRRLWFGWAERQSRNWARSLGSDYGMPSQVDRAVIGSDGFGCEELGLYVGLTSLHNAEPFDVLNKLVTQLGGGEQAA